ncbi:MAG: hypothetical protein VKJ06_04630 [Vampirovibrionales bacterium]|nr:hypothetical protein [Vampirovibrionales bacterium]
MATRTHHAIAHAEPSLLARFFSALALVGLLGVTSVLALLLAFTAPTAQPGVKMLAVAPLVPVLQLN